MDIIQVPGLVAAVILGQKCGDQLFGKGLLCLATYFSN